VNRINSQGFVDEPWRIAAHKLAKAGDRVWVLKQGRRPRGIFAAGEITGHPVRGDAGNGKVQWMVPVRFNTFVDPKQRLIVGEPDTAHILRPTQIKAQASGYPLDPEQSSAFEEILAAGSSIELGGSADWTEHEILAIVADYFSMLEAELAQRVY